MDQNISCEAVIRPDDQEISSLYGMIKSVILCPIAHTELYF
jgi:hypothetical protein